MIGGLVANAIDPTIMEQLAARRPAILITGTNGKSTTTRMLAAAMRRKYSVATNDGGDNMDAGIISALMAGAGASRTPAGADHALGQPRGVRQALPGQDSPGLLRPALQVL